MDHVNFVHPLISVMGRVVNFMRHDWLHAQCVVIAPLWFGTPWLCPLYDKATSAYDLGVGEEVYHQVIDAPLHRT